MSRALIVGLYEVLVARDFSEARPGASIKIYRHIPFGEKAEKILVRPYAKDFLKDCRNFFDTVILASCAPRSYVESVLYITGFTHLFDQILCGEDIDSGDLYSLRSSEVGLIDHRSCDDEDLGDKFALFHIPEEGTTGKEINGAELKESSRISNHLIKATPYRGNPDDCYLLDLLWAFAESEKLEEQVT